MIKSRIIWNTGESSINENMIFKHVRQMHTFECDAKLQKIVDD